jgi:hypothetical protein
MGGGGVATRWVAPEGQTRGTLPMGLRATHHVLVQLLKKEENQLISNVALRFVPF